jgi:adenine phosphoribosyltransferase
VDLRAHNRDIRDFPKEGIVFKDLTTLLLHPEALAHTIDLLSRYAEEREVELVVAAEARGFILGGAVAARVGAGFIPARKPGKLPADVDTVEYTLEYGLDALEVHNDALSGGARVLVHDDLLATGGTARALCELVESAGGEVVACAFLLELAFLDGRDRLAGYPVHALLHDDTE